MAGIDKKAWIAQAQQLGEVYPIKPGWRKAQYFAAVLTCLLIFTLPLGIWMILCIRRAHAGTTPDGFYSRMYGTNAARWSDIEGLRLGRMNIRVQGGGLVGALAGAAITAAVEKRTIGLNGPIEYKLKGKRMWRAFPAHLFQNSVDLALRAESQTGIRFLPDELRPEAGSAPQAS